jgi:hypothetical protein
MRVKRAQLAEALVGTIKDHHRFLLCEALNHIDALDQAIMHVGQEIEARMDPPEALIEDKTVAVESVIASFTEKEKKHSLLSCLYIQGEFFSPLKAE